MFKPIFRSAWFCSQPCLPLVVVALLVAPSPSALADNDVATVELPLTVPSIEPLKETIIPQLPNELKLPFGIGDWSFTLVPPKGPDTPLVPDAGKDKSSKEVVDPAPEIDRPLVQSDPLDSPHPVPWNWVLATQAQVSVKGGSGVRYYRSRSLVSPDGQYAAYSRIQLDVQPELYRSRVTSVMFLENLKTKELRVITASSPLAEHQFSKNPEASKPGTIAILIPVSWSPGGDRLLARQFEGLFSTSDASDYAVVWDRQSNSTSTITPGDVQYSNAVLLGWSQTNPSQVLFRAGELGDEKPPLWAVNLKGQTVAALEDKPLIVGQLVNYLWAGPQAHW